MVTGVPTTSLSTATQGLARASAGFEKAANGVMSSALQRVDAIDQFSESSDKAMLSVPSTPSFEDSMVDMKAYQNAYRANAAVVRLESQRSDLFSELVARHGTSH